MQNTLTKKNLKSSQASGVPAPLSPRQDIRVEPFKLSNFTSRGRRKRRIDDPRQMLLWATED